jgi:hypothetical protein
VRLSHGYPNAWDMILENPETGKKTVQAEEERRRWYV